MKVYRTFNIPFFQHQNIKRICKPINYRYDFVQYIFGKFFTFVQIEKDNLFLHITAPWKLFQELLCCSHTYYINTWFYADFADRKVQLEPIYFILWMKDILFYTNVFKNSVGLWQKNYLVHWPHGYGTPTVMEHFQFYGILKYFLSISHCFSINWAIFTVLSIVWCM